jgi:hypothetical protein
VLFAGASLKSLDGGVIIISHNKACLQAVSRNWSWDAVFSRPRVTRVDDEAGFEDFGSAALKPTCSDAVENKIRILQEKKKLSKKEEKVLSYSSRRLRMASP